MRLSTANSRHRVKPLYAPAGPLHKPKIHPLGKLLPRKFQLLHFFLTLALNTRSEPVSDKGHREPIITSSVDYMIIHRLVQNISAIWDCTSAHVHAVFKKGPVQTVSLATLPVATKNNRVKIIRH